MLADQRKILDEQRAAIHNDEVAQAVVVSDIKRELSKWQKDEASDPRKKPLNKVQSKKCGSCDDPKPQKKKKRRGTEETAEDQMPTDADELQDLLDDLRWRADNLQIDVEKLK
ncbi:hypothetical protein GN958_ATG12841 [Phytophthora infestans]|uniref:Uncharacterized protein n=1 Tax=Phytophthora infestans TaxID=4787 RepID=A0A8S9UHF1_PHYIN|nr:hypothetical protein GN958_ATG12841 [Phytophthora infestans]